MTTADLFVRCLEEEGVEYVFGIPGEENLDLLESLRRSKKITFILTRHEQSAGFMAATIGRLTGRAGVALSTLGPGATNFATAAAYSQLGALPALFITGQKPIKKSKQGRFQIVNIVEMMRPMTKYARQVVSGELVPSLIREAFRRAEEERPGAVHLELPEDIAAEKAPSDAVPIARHTVRRAAPDEKSISAAAAALSKAKRPLLLVGAGANRKHIGGALLSFLEATHIPFINTQMGKGIVPKAHEYYLGTCALSTGDYVHRMIEKADFIVSIGHDVVEKPPFIMSATSPTVLHIDFNSAMIDEVYFPQLEVVGDIATSLTMLAAALTKNPHAFDTAPFFEIQKKLSKDISEKSTDDSFPILPQRLVADVRAVMPEHGIISLDNGMYKLWFARSYRAAQQNTVLLDNALATMGAGLPGAMAARLVHPDTPIMAICGDGGFMMNSQELETAVRLSMNLVVLIINDNGYGMIRWKQEGEQFQPFGLSCQNPDFVRYAESYGATGHRVTTAAQLQPLLRACLKKGGVQVIDCPIDYSQNALLSLPALSKKTAT